MTEQVPLCSSKKALKAFKRLGFRETGHKRGSHTMLERRHDDGRVDAIPFLLGKKEINRFTLKGMLDQGNVDVRDFNDAL